MFAGEMHPNYDKRGVEPDPGALDSSLNAFRVPRQCRATWISRTRDGYGCVSAAIEVPIAGLQLRVLEKDTFVSSLHFRKEAHRGSRLQMIDGHIGGAARCKYARWSDFVDVFHTGAKPCEADFLALHFVARLNSGIGPVKSFAPSFVQLRRGPWVSQYDQNTCTDPCPSLRGASPMCS